MVSRSWLPVATALLFGCGGSSPPTAGAAAVPPTPPSSAVEPSFDDDVDFLRAHLPDLVVLERGSSRVAIAPDYQGRVMTSTAGGGRAASFGWIHRELIASGELVPHMNTFGGEDRFWLGPEGGPFALYFKPGAPFDLENWQVPAAIDSEPWPITSRAEHEVSFARDLVLENYAGTKLSLRARRTVRLLDAGSDPRAARPGVRAVAYESDNAVENTGTAPWRPESGLVSIWILSMYRPSPTTTVVVPFRRGPVETLGPIVNDAYFGAIGADRLRVDEARGVVFFRADGRSRGKIGVAHRRARPVLGSWDAELGVLTLVEYTLPGAAPYGYVDSSWGPQDSPYAGDVVNAYNDGPPVPGAPPLGPFYELESSSPAAALAPGERIEHVHRTLHLEGPREALDAVALEALGVGLDGIEAALTR